MNIHSFLKPPTVTDVLTLIILKKFQATNLKILKDLDLNSDNQRNSVK